MITLREIVSANIVEIVDCPVCWQRKYRATYCKCCKGLGYVDVDRVYSVTEGTLGDACCKETKADDWLAVGIYPVLCGAYIVRDDRTVDWIEDEQFEQAWRYARARRSWWSRFIDWVLGVKS